MTHEPENPMLPVTQEDRDFAVTVLVELSRRGVSPEVNAQFLRDIIDGGHDDDWLVQAISRHRSTRPAPASDGDKLIEELRFASAYEIGEKTRSRDKALMWRAAAALRTRAPSEVFDEVVKALRGLADVVEHDCECPPCIGSMAPAEHYLGLARAALALVQVEGGGE